MHPDLMHQTVETAGASGITHAMMVLMIQLAVILLCAKIGGYLFSRFLRMPSVLGELAAGMLIGPYALGAWIQLPHGEPLFSLQAGFAASPELYGIATLASIILLFLSGLETDLETFLRYSVVGSAVGLCGLLFSFLFGTGIAVLWPNQIDSVLDPAALFLGVISVATSVGITARILAEKRKMASPEGVTILAGAVFDDVLGIITLAVVLGMAKVQGAAGGINWGDIGIVALKAIGFFIVMTVGGLLLARRITALIKRVHSTEMMVALCFGLALLLAGLSEMAGLAMIVGAYITGLALSRTDLVHEVEERLQGIYSLLVPVFFCVMGMMVDFRAMHGVLLFGLAYSALAMAAKVLGCGLPAFLMRFNLKGALRIGLGMMPRGEVALIIAGIGFSAGVIDQGIFGVAILMTVLTTMLAPPLLVRSFRTGSGVRHETDAGRSELKTIDLDFPSTDITEFVLNRYVRALQREEFFVHRLHTDQATYNIRKDDIVFTLMQKEDRLTLSVPQEHLYIANMILLEELLSLTDLLDAAKKMGRIDQIGSRLLDDLFHGSDPVANG